jgi:hypothetical protein
LSDACEFTTVAVAQLDAPTNLASSDETATTATATWDAVDNVDHYLYSLDDGSTWEATELLTNSVDLESLTPETAYSFKVKAMADDSGNYSDSDPSATLTITTLAS